MTASYIYAASQPHTCATQKPYHLHLVHQASAIYAYIIMMVYSLTTMMMGEISPPAAAPDEGDEFIKSRTGLHPKVKTNNYTLSTSLLLLHIMLLVGHSSPLTSCVMNLNRLSILLQWISHRNAPEVKGYIGRTYELLGPTRLVIYEVFLLRQKYLKYSSADTEVAAYPWTSCDENKSKLPGIISAPWKLQEQPSGFAIQDELKTSK